MNNYTELPEKYKEIEEINLMKDKKLMFLINSVAIAIMILMFILGHVIVPISTLFNFDNGLFVYCIRIAALLLGYVAYIFLHEFVHGIFMKKFGKIKVSYGFNGLYAYAGSKAYFNRKSYIIIALAPIIVWGIILLILNFIVPTSWFWVIYFIQIGNISGAAGDIYVTIHMMKKSDDILIQDSGFNMKIFSAK